MKSFIIQKQENGIRLDNYIKLKVKASFSFLQMMERKKIVRVNKVHPKDYKVLLYEGDEISFYLSDDLFIEKEIIKPNFDIIYENKNLMIIDKDKHVMVHGDNIDNHNTLIDYVVSYLIKTREYIPSIKGSFKPAIITRLDTNTSGLVLVAKSKETSKILKDAIDNREIEKYYLALLKGTFKVKKDILKDYVLIDEEKGLSRIFRENVEGSKEIITGYEVLDERNNLSLVLVKLLTGRLHQIRAHMAFYNHPVIGDNKYGDKNLNKKLNISSQELISYKIIFPSELKEKLGILSKENFFISKKNVKNI